MNIVTHEYSEYSGYEYSDSEGRVVLINVSINKQWFSLCNIYAPTDNVKQNAFLNNLVTLIMSKAYIESLIIGGDWNATLNKIDKQGLRKWAPSSYRDNIISAMNELDLIDIMRDLHPKKKMFTYESKQYKSKSRLDFFLISNKLKQCISKTSIRIPVRSDHKAVGLQLKLSVGKLRGPGTWKFNNTLLEDGEYIEKVHREFNHIKLKYEEVKNPQLLWELIKMEIRSLTIKFSKQKTSGLDKEREKCKNL